MCIYIHICVCISLISITYTRVHTCLAQSCFDVLCGPFCDMFPGDIFWLPGKVHNIARGRIFVVCDFVAIDRAHRLSGCAPSLSVFSVAHDIALAGPSSRCIELAQHGRSGTSLRSKHHLAGIQRWLTKPGCGGGGYRIYSCIVFNLPLSVFFDSVRQATIQSDIGGFLILFCLGFPVNPTNRGGPVSFRRVWAHRPQRYLLKPPSASLRC